MKIGGSNQRVKQRGISHIKSNDGLLHIPAYTNDDEGAEDIDL